MADIKRTLSELLIDYADNSIGAITPSKLRNGFKSVFGSTDVYTITSGATYNATADNVVIMYSYAFSQGYILLPAVSATDTSGYTYSNKEYVISNISQFNANIIDLKNYSTILTLGPGDYAYVAADTSAWNVVSKFITSGFIKNDGSNAMTGQLNVPSISANYIQINTATSFTSGFTPSAGTISWNSDDKTMNIGLENSSVLQVGQEEILYAVNKTGSTITNGQIVKVTGSSGNIVVISLGQATSAVQSPSVFAIATQSISNNQSGYFTRYGLIRDINTSSWNEGDLLWLSTSAGMLTNVQPGKAYTQVPVAIVTRKHAVVGTIMAAPQWIPRISSLAGVEITSAVNGNGLVYVSATNTWQNYGNMYAYDDVATKFYQKEGKWDSTTTTVSANSATWCAGGVSDGKVKVTSGDSNPDYLSTKIQAASGSPIIVSVSGDTLILDAIESDISDPLIRTINLMSENGTMSFTGSCYSDVYSAGEWEVGTSQNTTDAYYRVTTDGRGTVSKVRVFVSILNGQDLGVSANGYFGAIRIGLFDTNGNCKGQTAWTRGISATGTLTLDLTPSSGQNLTIERNTEYWIGICARGMDLISYNKASTAFTTDNSLRYSITIRSSSNNASWSSNFWNSSGGGFVQNKVAIALMTATS